MAPNEHDIEFSNRRGQRLRATLASTANDFRAERGVLLTHGLGGHRNERHIRTIAQAIAERGFLVCSVDLADNAGESDGRFSDLTISREVDDATDATLVLESLLSGERLIGQCGHSFGGLIALLLSARVPEDVEPICALSTVFDAPARFRAMRAEREAEFRERGVLQLGDNPEMALGPAFFDDLDRWDVAAEGAKVRAPALILHGTEDDEVDVAHAHEYNRALVNSNRALRLIEGGDHTYTDPRALDEVAGTVASWFGTVLQ